MIFTFSNGKRWSPCYDIFVGETAKEQKEHCYRMAVNFGRNRYGAEVIDVA